MPQLAVVLLLAGVFVASSMGGIDGKDQSVAASGTILCDGKPVNHAVIELWDVDRTDPDDLMANATTSWNGKFLIIGVEREFTTIDPELRIFHKCGNSDAKCFNSTVIQIPDEYVTAGEKPNTTYAAGNIDLSAAAGSVSKRCN